MTAHTQSALKGFFLALILVSTVAFASSLARAKEGPSAEDYTRLAQIKENQKVIAANRDAYSQFVSAKNSNADLVRALNKNGWNVDWQTMKIVPFR